MEEIGTETKRGTLVANEKPHFADGQREQTGRIRRKIPLLARMPNPFRLLILWLASIAIAMAAPQTAEQKPVNIPQVSAYNLEKEKVTLPSGFTAPVNLLILFFDQDRHQEAESWISAATQLGNEAKQDLHYYLLPVFAKQNFLSRWWMNSSMRSGTPNASTWKWTVPLYLNKEDFKQELNIHSEHEVTVLLVDKTGKVLWRNSGPFTPEKRVTLLAALSDTSGSH